MITAAPKISFKEIILNQRCLSDLIGSVLTSHTFTLNLQNLKKKSTELGFLKIEPGNMYF